MANLVEKAEMTEQQRQALANAIMNNDLSQLSEIERVGYVNQLCDKIGISLLSRPFDFLVTGKKIQLYANKNCCEQLRQKYGISIKIVNKSKDDFGDGVVIYSVTAEGTMGDRTDTSIGSVVIPRNMSPEAIANAIMKAETKAKNRVTKSLIGLGMLDESELDTVPNVKKISFEEGLKFQSEQAQTQTQPQQPQSKPIEIPKRNDALLKEYLEYAIFGKFNRDVEQIRKDIGADKLVLAAIKKNFVINPDGTYMISDDLKQLLGGVNLPEKCHAKTAKNNSKSTQNAKNQQNAANKPSWKETIKAMKVDNETGDVVGVEGSDDLPEEFYEEIKSDLFN